MKQQIKIFSPHIKSYTTEKRANAAINKFYGKVRYIITITPEGRFQPVILMQGTEDPMRFPHSGFMLVG